MLRIEVFEAVVGHLERHEIADFVTGLLASSYYGEPRLTRDADLALDIAVQDAEPLCRRMSALGYYADEKMGAEAVRQSGQFNVIDARMVLISNAMLDFAYLVAWGLRLGVLPEWRAVRDKVAPPEST